MLKIFRQIYVQVLIAIVAGALLGHYFPHIGQSVAPLSTAFIKLVKMVIVPLIFVTIVLGAKEMGGAGALGRIGGKTIILFELTTTIALLLGLVGREYHQAGREPQHLAVDDRRERAVRLRTLDARVRRHHRISAEYHSG